MSLEEQVRGHLVEALEADLIDRGSGQEVLPLPPSRWYLTLQYRERREWAVGHNTSLLVPRSDADGEMRELQTTQLPRYEVRRVLHEAVGGETGMERLALLDGVELTHALTAAAPDRRRWSRCASSRHAGAAI